MSDRAKAILDSTKGLTPEERAEIAEALLAELDDEPSEDVEAANKREIERRLDNSDESKLIPMDVAMKMAKARKYP